MKKPATVLVSLAFGALLASCGGGGSSSTTTPGEGETTYGKSSTPVSVMSRSLPKLGTVLVNGEGRTLYVFAPDKGKKVTCVSSCAAVWPPLKVEAGQKASAAGQVKASLLGSYPDPEGGEVVTYAGWPLYAYVADTQPGEARGQALNLNGGYWYVISASGKVIK